MSKTTAVLMGLYSLGGLGTIAWATSRAGRNGWVWPGVGKNPPGAMLGAVETFTLWPLAALQMARHG